MAPLWARHATLERGNPPRSTRAWLAGSRSTSKRYARCRARSSASSRSTRVRVPLEAEHRSVSLPPATTVNNYHGPVVTVTGDHAQIAWGNRDVQQHRVEQIAPGYDHLAQLVTDLLANLHAFALDDGDETELRASADTLLGEVVNPVPDQGIIRRSVTMIKGLLAPVGSGASKAVTEETAEAAREVIDALGSALPF